MTVHTTLWPELVHPGHGRSDAAETGQQATRDSNSISGCSRLKVVLPVEQPTNILLVRQRSMVWHMFRILYTLTRVVTSGSDSRQEFD